MKTVMEDDMIERWKEESVLDWKNMKGLAEVVIFDLRLELIENYTKSQKISIQSKRNSRCRGIILAHLRNTKKSSKTRGASQLDQVTRTSCK